jgi:hypothetical protein
MQIARLGDFGKAKDDRAFSVVCAVASTGRDRGRSQKDGFSTSSDPLADDSLPGSFLTAPGDA